MKNEMFESAPGRAGFDRPMARLIRALPRTPRTLKPSSKSYLKALRAAELAAWKEPGAAIVPGVNFLSLSC